MSLNYIIIDKRKEEILVFDNCDVYLKELDSVGSHTDSSYNHIPGVRTKEAQEFIQLFKSDASPLKHFSVSDLREDKQPKPGSSYVPGPDDIVGCAFCGNAYPRSERHLCSAYPKQNSKNQSYYDADLLGDKTKGIIIDLKI